MISESESTDIPTETRRVLTHPAVHPSKNVSPAALLGSLLSISHNIIGYRSKSSVFFFYSNHRVVSESIRLVRLLSDFFSEIKSHHVTSTVLLCLSDLYIIFQRIEFLLQDCCRDDCRLWMLMKCDCVADQFRSLMRTLSTTVDVIPMHLLHVPSEVQETTQLVIKQARTSPYDVTSGDRHSSNKIMSILDQFEEGIAPESSELRSILSHLGIQSWGQCNQEINFLESELELESSNYVSPKNKTDLPLLVCLLGFMSYCRSVLFVDVIDYAHNNNNNNKKKNKAAFQSYDAAAIRHLNPDDLRCPISLEIMADPVTLCTGHTYDRSSISKWLSNNVKPTCPKTAQLLTRKTLLPNLNLKRLIQQQQQKQQQQNCHDKGNIIINEAETMMPPCKDREKRKSSVLVGAESVKMLGRFLAGVLAADKEEEKDTVLKMNKAAYEILLLTRTSNLNRSCLAEAGVIPFLLKHIKNSAAEDAVSQENAMEALFNLSEHPTSKPIIIENGGLSTVVKILREGAKVEARQHAAGTLYCLASVQEYLPLIGEAPGCIPGLMCLIWQGSYRSKKKSLMTITALLRNRSNHKRIVSSAHLVPLVGRLLEVKDEKEDIVIECLSILDLLTERPAGIMAVLKARVLSRVVEILCWSDSETVLDHCVSILLAMCVSVGEELVPALVEKRSPMDPLLSLLKRRPSWSPPGRKVSTLIRIIRNFQETSLPTGGYIEQRYRHARARPTPFLH
ncbi:U-box domain-containing protein 19-like [Impatiens glandulifera]|uniref:U-box domain-containing protein 19-like n=1 Tax=Impatiens glandulifera TaxID=253017 RepID=UPI001FB1001B|nr:U-box domain-containing protein 19-like [Impatiens glandulifera]